MTHRRPALLVLGAMLASLAGCDGAQDLFEVPLDQPHSVVTESDGLRLTFEVEKIGYEIDEPVAFMLTVENISDADQVLPFANSCMHDFIAHQGDVLVWNHYSHVICFEEYTEIELQPGQSLTFSTVWDQRSNDRNPVGAGRYKMTAELLRSITPIETDSLMIVIQRPGL